MVYCSTKRTGNQVMKSLLKPSRLRPRPKGRSRAVLLFSGVAVLAFVLAITDAAAQPGIELGAVSAAAGGTLLMPVSYQASDGDSIATLVLRLAMPAAQITVLDVIPSATVSTSGKSLDFEVVNSQVSICVFGGTSDIASGDLCVLLVRLNPDSPAGTAVTLTDAGTHGADKEATAVAVEVQEGVITVMAATNPHKADSNSDWSVSLSELLRIIQFYNVKGYHCDATSTDGFAPGSGDTGCAAHDTDYNPTDWQISFVELLRMIQLYNSPYGVYHALEGTEDGFSPGPFGIFYDKRFAHLK